MAAAIGAGIDITKPDGHMVVDIGGGTADIAVISLGGVVESASIKVAGDQYNESVVKYMRRKHNILIGERTAEQMKMEIGCVYPKEEEATIEIKGRCLMTGLPKNDPYRSVSAPTLLAVVDAAAEILLTSSRDLFTCCTVVTLSSSAGIAWSPVSLTVCAIWSINLPRQISG